MLNVAFLVSLGLAGVSTPQIPVQTPETRPSVALEPPVPVEDEDVWTEQFLMLLQMICVVLDCGVARNEAEVSAQQWVEIYKTGGVRPNLSPEIRAEARIQLTAMDALAARGAGGLTPALRAEFRATIAGILQEISE